MDDKIGRTLNNTIRLALFVILAMSFDKWWLVLFAILFMDWKNN